MNTTFSGRIVLQCAFAAGSLFSFVFAAAGADPWQVELTVQESAGLARKAEPISGGVPLPAGRFKEGQSFALFRADGSPVPCQFSPLVVERDRTLRWILLDYQDDVAAGANLRYTLKAVKPATTPTAQLKVEQDSDGVRVDTGRINFTVSKTEPFGLFSQVAADETPTVRGGRISYEQMHGRAGFDDKAEWQTRQFNALPPDTIKLHYNGPLRVTIAVEGRFADDPLKAGYQAWITTWAGQTRVRVKYKLCNSNPDQYTAILVGRSTVRLELYSDVSDVTVGAKTAHQLGKNGWIHQGLFLHHTHQDVAAAARAGVGKYIVWSGNGPADRPSGWIAAKTLPYTVQVCDQTFAWNPPRRLSVDGRHLVLEGIAQKFVGPKDEKFRQDRRIGEPFQSPGKWLFDCTHHSSEYLIDFAASDFTGNALAAASRNRLWVLAPGEYYSQCGVLGTRRFGTLADELDSYDAWGWQCKPEQVVHRADPEPGACVVWEDNHYESEADSVQGLLLMYLRTGERGWFDLAEAWARYHMDLQAWRTDGWRWKDGGIWFPSGGPPGNRPVREKWNFKWAAPWGERKTSVDCIDLWREAQAKGCYCHYYGSGLADYFCLTGDPDALAAAIDNVEQKDDEFRHYRQFQPGESAVGSIRGFGRGFEVMMRVLMADPQNDYIRGLCHLSARTLWESPLLDERGFHCSRIGGGYGGMSPDKITPAVKKWMDSQGIRFKVTEGSVDTLTKGDRTWPVRCMGGTWQHIYIQNGADLYADYFDDDNMRDFTVAFAQMSARYMLSPKCRQTWYYTFFDVPDLGHVFDPWKYEHTDTTDGEGCVHSGWYTRFYPDVCAKGYSLTGEPHLLEKARDFWYYGSKRGYRTKGLSGGPNEVARLAGHTPPKDDTVLETACLFHETAHRRTDSQPPAAVKDLAVNLLDGDRAEVRFTAPDDAGGGRVVRYQVKASELPIAPYEQWDFARDHGRRQNWWRAVNCDGEPAPGKPGTQERFVVTGVPADGPLHFAVRSFDDSGNRSAMSNLAVTE